MELSKAKDNLTYQALDVKFFIRATPTARDKLELDTLGSYEDGRFVMKRSAFFQKIVELFVTGWDGVTEDGKPVPYSYETFMTRFPYDASTDWILKLGAFISDALGLFSSEAADQKNG